MPIRGDLLIPKQHFASNGEQTGQEAVSGDGWNILACFVTLDFTADLQVSAKLRGENTRKPGLWDVILKSRRPKVNSCLLGRILRAPTQLIRHAVLTFTSFYLMGVETLLEDRGLGSSWQVSSLQTQGSLLVNFAEASAREKKAHVSNAYSSSVTPSCKP